VCYNIYISRVGRKSHNYFVSYTCDDVVLYYVKERYNIISE